MHTPSTSGDQLPAGQIRLSAFWRKWYYFAFAVPLTCGLGVLHFLMVTPTYQVTARLLVEERGRPLGEEPGGDRENAHFLPTHAEIISSPAVISRAASMMTMPPKVEEDESLIEAILERLEVQPLVGTHVLSIAYQDSTPAAATEGLDLIVKSYQQYLRDSEQSAHQETILLLANRADTLREEMRDLQTEYETVRRESPLLGHDQDAASVQRGMLTRLNEELIGAKSRQIALESQLKTVIALRSGEPAGPLKLISAKPGENPAGRNRASIEILSRLSNDGLISGINPQGDFEALLQAELEYAELRKQFGERHPDVQAVAERIATLSQRLDSIVQVAPNAIQQEVKSLQRQEEHLAQLYQKEFAQAKQIDEYLVKGQQKQDEINLVKAAHDTIVTQLNNLRLADHALNEGRASVSVRLLDKEELVEELIWPQPKPLAALCLLAGLAAGAVLVVASEKLLPASEERDKE